MSLEKIYNALSTYKYKLIQQNMPNCQFDLTNDILLNSFKPQDFAAYCSRNGKESNLQMILSENLNNVIETATKIKKNIDEHLTLNTVFSRKKKSNLCPTWAFSEYKFFTYLTYFYSFMKGTGLANLAIQDLNILSYYFPDKPISFLIFEYRCLLKVKKERWTSIEDQALIQTIQKNYSKGHKISWKIVAFQMFESSRMKIFRNYKECRQRWANHLNPDVNRTEWSLEEDRLLFNLVYETGKKWSKVAQSMNSTRTEHMIKNRYNSYLRKWKKLLGSKREDHYLKEIISYLSAINLQGQANQIVQKSTLLVSFQQQKTSKTKRHKHTHQLQNQSNPFQDISAMKVEEQHSIQHQVFSQSIELNNQEPEVLPLEYSLQNAQNERQQLQRIDLIPEYMAFQERNEANFVKTMPDNIQNYLQRDPEYQKVVDDTWLSQLQQKENLKWLQCFQQ